MLMRSASLHPPFQVYETGQGVAEKAVALISILTVTPISSRPVFPPDSPGLTARSPREVCYCEFAFSQLYTDVEILLRAV